MALIFWEGEDSSYRGDLQCLHPLSEICIFPKLDRDNLNGEIITLEYYLQDYKFLHSLQP